MTAIKYLIFKGMFLFPGDCFSYVVSRSGSDVSGSDVGSSTVDSSVGISVVVTDVVDTVADDDTVLLVGVAVVRVFRGLLVFEKEVVGIVVGIVVGTVVGTVVGIVVSKVVGKVVSAVVGKVVSAVVGKVVGRLVTLLPIVLFIFLLNIWIKKLI
jgi:hypothetical protein